MRNYYYNKNLKITLEVFFLTPMFRIRIKKNFFQKKPIILMIFYNLKKKFFSKNGNFFTNF